MAWHPKDFSCKEDILSCTKQELWSLLSSWRRKILGVNHLLKEEEIRILFSSFMRGHRKKKQNRHQVIQSHALAFIQGQRGRARQKYLNRMWESENITGSGINCLWHRLGSAEPKENVVRTIAWELKYCIVRGEWLHIRNM